MGQDGAPEGAAEMQAQGAVPAMPARDEEIAGGVAVPMGTAPADPAAAHAAADVVGVGSAQPDPAPAPASKPRVKGIFPTMGTTIVFTEKPAGSKRLDRRQALVLRNGPAGGTSWEKQMTVRFHDALEDTNIMLTKVCVILRGGLRDEVTVAMRARGLPGLPRLSGNNALACTVLIHRGFPCLFCMATAWDVPQLCCCAFHTPALNCQVTSLHPQDLSVSLSAVQIASATCLPHAGGQEV